MLLTDEEEAEGENEISLIVPRAVAKLVKHFAVFSLPPRPFLHVISFHFLRSELIVILVSLKIKIKIGRLRLRFRLRVFEGKLVKLRHVSATALDSKPIFRTNSPK